MKAIIPCAGFGTRFLPATKTTPKEMLTVVDKPLILYAVEEALEAGIEEIILITSAGKSTLEDFFDSPYGLKAFLKEKNKTHLLAPLEETLKKARIFCVRQAEAKGLGHAILQGQPLCQNSPFAVLLPDEMILKAPSQEISTLETLIRSYEETGKSSIATIEVPREDIHKYGIIETHVIDELTYSIHKIIEKPSLEQTQSQLALPGRYVFSPALFDALRNTAPGKGGEIQLTDAMNAIIETEGLLAKKVFPLRFDAGDKLGFLKAQAYLGLKDPRFSQEYRSFLHDILENSDKI